MKTKKSTLCNCEHKRVPHYWVWALGPLPRNYGIITLYKTNVGMNSMSKERCLAFVSLWPERTNDAFRSYIALVSCFFESLFYWYFWQHDLVWPFPSMWLLALNLITYCGWQTDYEWPIGWCKADIFQNSKSIFFFSFLFFFICLTLSVTKIWFMEGIPKSKKRKWQALKIVNPDF